MAKRGPRGTLTILSGAVAILSLFMPFYRLKLLGLPTFEVSGRAYWWWMTGERGLITGVVRGILRMSSGLDLVLWVVVLAYLLAGPAFIAYYGVRYLVGSISGGRYRYSNGALAAIAYAVVGWIGLKAFSARVSLPLELFSIADVGFWVGLLALVAGAAFWRYVHG